MSNIKNNKLSRKRKLTDKERFSDTDPKDIEEKRKAVQKVNTERSNKKCEKVFVQWLAHHEYNVAYWKENIETLNAYLSKFWFEARTQDGDYYSTATLEHICHGIN